MGGIIFVFCLAPLMPSGRTVLPSCGTSSNTRPSASRELKNLFHYSKNKRKNSDSTGGRKKKKQKLKMWNHTFVCLSSTTGDSVPDSMTRAELKMAGLGEKMVSVFLYGCSDELNDDLLDYIPKLSSGGGYELLRQGVGKNLDVIPIPPGGYTAEYLQSVLKCILDLYKCPWTLPLPHVM